jgi:hypothetical protein
MAKPKLTIKETKLVKAKAQGKTHIEAYKEAGYALSTPKAMSTNTSKILSRENVKEALDKALIRHGITLDRALAPISKGLDATKQNEYTGEITEDIKLQLQASDRALKLMGVGNDKDNPNVQNFIQVINEKGSKYNV